MLTPDTPATAPPILQFGTSRFLQAHVDLFVCEAARRHPGDALGKIAVVQTTQNAGSHARIAALREHRRYPVRIRGLRDQHEIDAVIDCDSVAEAWHAEADWQVLRERIRHDVQVIVSNTGDSGYAVFPDDSASLLGGNAAPRGFVAKLAVLLHERFVAGGEPITIMPCELVSRNGAVLRGMVIDVARHWGCAAAYLHYLEQGCLWINSLVDRIVSAAIDPVGAIAEPYALWAIERQAGMVLPCVHDCMVLTDDLAPFERRKLFLLNLGHSVLAQCWLDGVNGQRVGAEKTSVLQAMQHDEWRRTLEAVWRDEVMPVFTALGEEGSALHYLSDVRERLANPFLAHRLADIAQHHAEKKRRRFEPVITLASELGLSIEQQYLRTALASE